MGASELASRRIIAVAGGVLAALLVIVVPGVVGRAADRGLPGWYFVIVWSMIGTIILVGALAPWLSARSLRGGAIAATSAYAAFVLLFGPAASSGSAVERIPWMLSSVAVSAGMALLAGGVTLATAAIVFGGAAAFLYRVMYGGLDLDGLVNDTQSVLSAVVVTAVGAHLIAVSRGVDAARERAAVATARASTTRGRLAARTRAAALVHDEVLATLTLAASDVPIPRDALARQAARASRLVTEVDGENASPTGPLRVALARLARESGAEFRAAASGAIEPTPAAEEALLAAARQALENSVRHAGADAHLSVDLRVDGQGVAVEVADDGRGFDASRIADDRLGVVTSILRRVRDVPGGEAEIRSAPGEGTRVLLRWAPPPAPAEPAPQSSPRTAVTAIVVVFVVSQGVAALAAALAQPQWWVPPLVLLALLAIGDLVRRWSRPRPTLARSWVALALTLSVVGAAASVVPFTFGHLWFVTAAGFVSVALCLTGRPLVALWGAGALVAVVVLIAIARYAPAVTVGHVITRPAIVVTFAAVLFLVIGRMQARSAELHRHALDEAGRVAWDAAARAELAVRASELRALVVPTLDRLAEDRPLTDDDRRACLRIEGALRDEYRAGALVRAPLIGAVRAARERGVDVVLLDDGDGAASDPLLDEIAGWMAPLVDAARERVVGRLLPAGRAAPATLTVDGTTSAFRARARVAETRAVP